VVAEMQEEIAKLESSGFRIVLGFGKVDHPLQ